MKPSSLIYIFDTILDPNNGMYKEGVWFDIKMIHYVGGKERSIREWELLAKLAHLKINITPNFPNIAIGRIILSK
ncbi:hypothetical protein CYY_001158 [Polysphondylium violaceum]|uniref:Uncharacterized protein n=1 Tax=Polysphondylium violaceum TaxID=133409 RepID=A0A8J4Q1J1_9MYCE|nr:hypothetical protein CYY_001158 [Polysphondylium violaceum]